MKPLASPNLDRLNVALEANAAAYRRADELGEGSARVEAWGNFRMVSNSASVAAGVSWVLSKASNQSAWHETQRSTVSSPNGFRGSRCGCIVTPQPGQGVGLPGGLGSIATAFVL